ncbi:membrane protein implicated in regulation of membrane protease activity [Streptomyces pristinaespiralis]
MGPVRTFSQQERPQPRRRRRNVDTHKIVIGGVAVGLLLMPLLGFWLSLLVVLGVPAVAYLMLDPSQRRRLRRVSRKEIGR